MLPRLLRALVARLFDRRPSLGSSRGRSGRGFFWLVLLAAGLLVGVAIRGESEPGDVEGDAQPRAILNRPWFDRYPEKPTEEVHLWLWFGGGIALHEQGSRYKATLEIFDFERSGANLDIRSLHDGRRTKTTFTVEACDDLPPFDLCLNLGASPSGPRKLYSFGDEDDLARRIPWAIQARRAAEERARAPRP